jgi:hypothetical protein
MFHTMNLFINNGQYIKLESYDMNINIDIEIINNINIMINCI